MLDPVTIPTAHILGKIYNALPSKEAIYDKMPTAETLATGSMIIGTGLAAGGIPSAGWGLLAYVFAVKPTMEATRYCSQKMQEKFPACTSDSNLAAPAGRAAEILAGGVVLGALAPDNKVVTFVTVVTGLATATVTNTVVDQKMEKAGYEKESAARRAANFLSSAPVAYGTTKLTRYIANHSSTAEPGGIKQPRPLEPKQSTDNPPTETTNSDNQGNSPLDYTIPMLITASAGAGVVGLVIAIGVGCCLIKKKTITQYVAHNQDQGRHISRVEAGIQLAAATKEITGDKRLDQAADPANLKKERSKQSQVVVDMSNDRINNVTKDELNTAKDFLLARRMEVQP